MAKRYVRDYRADDPRGRNRYRPKDKVETVVEGKPTPEEVAAAFMAGALALENKAATVCECDCEKCGEKAAAPLRRNAWILRTEAGIVLRRADGDMTAM